MTPSDSDSPLWQLFLGASELGGKTLQIIITIELLLASTKHIPSTTQASIPHQRRIYSCKNLLVDPEVNKRPSLAKHRIDWCQPSATLLGKQGCSLQMYQSGGNRTGKLWL